jgi:nitroreductase
VTLEGPELVRNLLAESRRPPGPREVPERLRRQLPLGDTWPLPAPLAGEASPVDVLRRRGAVRRYGGAPIPLAAVATALAAADRGDLSDWPSERDAGVELGLFVVAWNVAGLPPAVYRYAAEAHQLVGVAPAPQGPADRLVRQPEFTGAAAFVEVVGNLAAAVARHGSHGHRLLLVRAGAAAHRAWLAALSAGLAGCIFEGLLPQPFREVSGADGYTKARLVACAIGHEAVR